MANSSMQCCEAVQVLDLIDMSQTFLVVEKSLNSTKLPTLHMNMKWQL